MSRKTTNKKELERIKEEFAQVAKDIETVETEEFLRNNFLPYAWSSILDRALVDNSGLKPVQRRILYTMFKRRLGYKSNRQKVATLGGAVLALHPHGDASVNEALKNLGREHIFRVPMIDGKGDFGSPGGPGAAPRYLEARLSEAGWINVEDLNEKAVSFMPSYDDTDIEPVKIPVKWPISLINGTSGIATGYSSNIPSHNPDEVMKALRMLLKNPKVTDNRLLNTITGPDFNMGGTVTSNDGVKEYLLNGSGTFKIRGNYDVISLPRGRTRIEFYEIPYGTNPEKIITEIQEKEAKGLIKGVSSYKDLSDLKNPIRVVIEIKSGVQYQKVLLELFKNTSLETSFPANITTIVNDKPVQTGIRPLLLDFIEFRKEIVRNKTQYNLERKESRLHLVEGLLLVLLDIDEAIKIIRNSNNPTSAKNNLRRHFKISEKQALHILQLQLQRLTRMDRNEIDKEQETLVKEIAELKDLLNNEATLVKYLDKEFEETLKVISSPRKTIIMEKSLDEALKEEEELVNNLKESNENRKCYITRFSNDTLIKTIENPFIYNIKTAKTLRNAPIVDQIEVMTDDNIVLIGSDGVGRRVPVSYLGIDRIQTAKQIGVTFPSGVKLVGISKNETPKDEVGLAIGTMNGVVKITKTDFPLREDEFPVITIEDGDKIVNTAWINKKLEETFFSFINTDGNVLTFDASTVRVSGSKAGGVVGMKLRNKKQRISSFNWVDTPDESCFISQTEKTLKMTPFADVGVKGRGGLGMNLQRFNKGETKIINSYTGKNPIITVKGEKKIVSPPPMSKRAAAGVPCPFPCEFGSTNLT